MINFLNILIILVWPFGQLAQLSPVGGSLRLHLLDILTFLLSTLLLSNREYRAKIAHDKLTKPMLIFITALAFSLGFAAIFGQRSTLLSALLYLLRFVSYFGIYFSFSIFGLKKYLRYFYVSALIFLSIGFAQYIFLPDIRFIKSIGFDDHYYRLVGSLLDPNFTGLILTIFVLSSLQILKSKYKLLFLVPLTALVLTFSRASYLALAAGLIYIGVATKRYNLIAIIAILALILYLVPKPFGEGVNLLRTFSIFSRLDNQVAALNTFSKNLIFGVGFNTLKSGGVGTIPNLSSGVDNSFIFVLVTAGLAGIASFIYFLKKSWESNPSTLVRASSIAIFTHSLINNSFFYSWILAIYLVLLNLKSKKSV